MVSRGGHGFDFASAFVPRNSSTLSARENCTMAIDDMLDSKAGVAGLAAALTAAFFSPRVRGILHQGAVYGVAGVLRAGDTVNAFARGVGRGLRGAQESIGSGNGADDDVNGSESEAESRTSTAVKRRRRPRGVSGRPASSAKSTVDARDEGTSNV
jgi:hypothetical protein